MSSLRTRIGPRIVYTRYCGSARVTHSISAPWQHEFLQDELPFDDRFAHDPGSLVTVCGPRVGLENYESQTALVGLRMSW